MNPLSCRAAVLAMLALPALASAQSQVQPFIYVDVSPKALDFGEMQPSLQFHDSIATLTMRVYANLSHGGVCASITPLVGPGGATIDPARVQMKRSDQATYTPLGSAVNFTGARPPGLFTYNLQFRVQTAWSDAPGTYSGTLVLTYGVAP